MTKRVGAGRGRSPSHASNAFATVVPPQAQTSTARTSGFSRIRARISGRSQGASASTMLSPSRPRELEPHSPAFTTCTSVSMQRPLSRDMKCAAQAQGTAASGPTARMKCRGIGSSGSLSKHALRQASASQRRRRREGRVGKYAPSMQGGNGELQSGTVFNRSSPLGHATPRRLSASLSFWALHPPLLRLRRPRWPCAPHRPLPSYPGWPWMQPRAARWALGSRCR